MSLYEAIFSRLIKYDPSSRNLDVRDLDHVQTDVPIVVSKLRFNVVGASDSATLLLTLVLMMKDC